MTTLLTLKEVKEIVKRSPSQIRVDIQNGVFPPPFKTGLRKVCWLDFEIDELVNCWVKGLSEQQIRKVVTDIVSYRKKLKNGDFLRRDRECSDVGDYWNTILYQSITCDEVNRNEEL